MPPPNPPPPAPTPLNDFSTKCHFVRTQYDCRHQIWARSHRAVHVGSCRCASTGRARCTNMARKPKVVPKPGLCSKCMPIELGVGGKLAPFEMLVPGCSEGGERLLENRRGQEHVQLGIGVGPVVDIKSVRGLHLAPGRGYQKPKPRLIPIATPKQGGTAAAPSRKGKEHISKHAVRPPTPTTTQPACDLAKQIDECHGGKGESDWESLSDGDLADTDSRLWRDGEDWVYVT